MQLKFYQTDFMHVKFNLLPAVIFPSQINVESTSDYISLKLSRNTNKVNRTLNIFISP